MEDAAKILNAGFEKFMAAGEKSEPILMYMFDLIFSFIALPPSQGTFLNRQFALSLHSLTLL